MIAIVLLLLPIGEPVIVERCDRLEVNTLHDADCGTKRFTQVILWRRNHRGSWSVDKWKMAHSLIVKDGKTYVCDGPFLREIRAEQIVFTATLDDPEVEERKENNQRFEWSMPKTKEP